MKSNLLILFFLMNFALSAQDITTGLVGYWPFCGNARDYSGNGNHGTVHGARLTDDRFGKPDNAYSFDGINDYILVNNSSLFDDIEKNDIITITAWINIRNWYQGNNIFNIVNKYCTSNDYGWLFEIGRLPYDYISFIPNIGYSSLTNWKANFNQWYHTAVTYNRSRQRLTFYIDGQLLWTGNVSQDIYDTQGGPLYIGYSPSGPDEYSDGIIDELRIYNRELTSEDITALCNLKTTPCDFPKITSDISIYFNSLQCDHIAYDSVWVKNSGTDDLIITSADLSGQDVKYFQILNPNLPSTIKPNDSILFKIKFESNINGKRNCKLNINNNSQTNPFSIDLNADREGDTYSSKIFVMDSSCSPQSKLFYLPVIAEFDSLPPKGTLLSCKAKITFDDDLFHLVRLLPGEIISDTMTGSLRTIEFLVKDIDIYKNRIKRTDSVLITKLAGQVMLTDLDYTDFIIKEFNWLADCIEADTITHHFNNKGICIKDLRNVKLLPKESLSVSPNPAENSVTIESVCSEIGYLSIIISDLTGCELKKYSWLQEYNPSSNIQKQQIIIELDKFNTGIYCVMLETPTKIITRPLIISR